MSFWAVIFIVLAIAMAVGPIMIMQPSSRDRRLAKFRQSAASLGLQVRMADYKANNAKRSIAVYSQAVELPSKAPSWVLLKQSYQHDIHFYGKWEWQEGSQALEISKHGALQAFLNELPDDIVGMEVNNKMIGIWWNEAASEVTIDQIKSWINQCYNIIC